MSMRCVLWFVLLCAPAVVEATPVVLTAARVVELARTTSPLVLSSEAAMFAPRGRLGSARALLPSNPTAEILATSDRRFDRRPAYGITVPFELGLKRARKIGVARAELERDEMKLLDSRRLAAGAALGAYYEVLHAERRLSIANDRLALAEELRRVAAERNRTGDAPRLDVSVASIEQARAASDVRAAEADVARRRAGLAASLGLPSGAALEIQGDLADRTVLGASVGQDVGAGERADVQAARSELEAAGASLSLAKLSFLPDLAFRLDYDREDVGSVLRRGVSLSVPIADFGQAERGEAKARREQARVELAGRRASAAAEAEAARQAYTSALAAVEGLEGAALVAAQETQTMAQESYRVGKINLSALLIVRREVIAAREDHADRLLDAALAGIDLAVARGTLP